MKTGKLHIWVPELVAREGGIQSYSIEMVEAAMKILGPEKVTVISKSDRMEMLRRRLGDEVRIYATGNVPNAWRTPVFAILLVVAAWWERPSLILSTHANFSPVAAWLQKWRKIPVVISAHGIEVWNLKEGAIRQALCKAAKILPVSEYTRGRMEREIGLPADRFEVISDTYNTEKFFPGRAPERLRSRWGLEGKKVIYTLARLDPGERYKGIDEVLEVLPEVLREIPELVYVIGGKGSDRGRLEERARAMGVAEQVIFAGFVPEEEKADAYRLANLFVMPGWGEGFGIVYLESAACGVPVLGSILDASAEVIARAGIGEAVNPKNPKELKEAILRMLRNPVKGPFAGLAQFDRTAFRMRVRDLLCGFGLGRDEVTGFGRDDRPGRPMVR